MSNLRFAAVLVASAFLAAGSARGENVLRSQLTPFLNQHCLTCHSGNSPKGRLDLGKLSGDLADAKTRRQWVYLYDRVAAGEMPPKSADQPVAKSKSVFLRTLAVALTKADVAGRKGRLRRLNRNEYQNTVCDLFGIDVDVSRLLPDDSADQGFDTSATALSLSAEQMVLYLNAADLVLDRIFGPPRKPPAVRKSWNSKDSRALRRSVKVTRNGIVLFNHEAFVMYEATARIPGTYRLKLSVKAVQTDKPLFMRVDGGLTMRIPPHVEGFYEVSPGKMTTVELKGRVVERYDNFAVSLVGGFPYSRVPASYKGPGLFIGKIEIEGPLEKWPPPSRAKLLGDVDPAKGTINDIRSILARVVPKAFRRATGKQDVKPFVALANQALKERKPFEQALRRGLKGVLCAPEFLFLEESLAKSDGMKPGRTIDDYAGASRLSYFLWSSLPDRELVKLASAGTLSRPKVLRTQVERMLCDPRSKRFVRNFTGQWLRLRDIDFTVPNRRLYPEYNQSLRQSMLDETHAFFREILDRNLGVQTFIDSDFVMVNQPLAEFYGIAGVKGLRIRRVKLAEGSLRGGVLTQASVLKVSADGTRTSPVLRGAWILKHFYGTPSPPPPPSVAAIEPDIRGATTIREQLAKHRKHESCNRCHRKIDPPGFALESFDVIGAQRKWYRTTGRGKFVKRLRHPQLPGYYVLYRRGADVDASGKLPDGRTFSGIRDYKRLLLKDETKMILALTRHLLTYSLGRELGFADRPEVERIVAQSKKDNFGLRSMIHAVVQSPLFRKP